MLTTQKAEDTKSKRMVYEHKPLDPLITSYSSIQHESADGKCDKSCNVIVSKYSAKQITYLTYVCKKCDVKRDREKKMLKKRSKIIRKYLRQVDLAMKASEKNESNKTVVDSKNKKNNRSKKLKRQSSKVDGIVRKGNAAFVIFDGTDKKSMNSSKDIINESEKLADSSDFTLKNPKLRKSDESQWNHGKANRKCSGNVKKSYANKNFKKSLEEKNLKNALLASKIRKKCELLINFIESVSKQSVSKK